MRCYKIKRVPLNYLFNESEDRRSSWYPVARRRRKNFMLLFKHFKLSNQCLLGKILTIRWHYGKSKCFEVEFVYLNLLWYYLESYWRVFNFSDPKELYQKEKEPYRRIMMNVFFFFKSYLHNLSSTRFNTPSWMNGNQLKYLKVINMLDCKSHTTPYAHACTAYLDYNSIRGLTVSQPTAQQSLTQT